MLDGTAVVWRDPVVAAAVAADGRGKPREAVPSVRRHFTNPAEHRHHTRRKHHDRHHREPRCNGVDTATLFATLDAVKGQPEIAKFQFRATNTWVDRDPQPLDVLRLLRRHAGDAAQARDRGRLRPPGRARRQDNGPTPVEYLLHAIAACLTAGIANIAAARGVDADQGLLDRRGRHRPARASSGCPTARSATATSRSGSRFHIEGDADDETLRGLVEQSRRRSAVYDALTNPTPVVIDVVTG